MELQFYVELTTFPIFISDNVLSKIFYGRTSKYDYYSKFREKA